MVERPAGRSMLIRYPAAADAACARKTGRGVATPWNASMTNENVFDPESPLPRHAEFERVLVELGELTSAEPRAVPGDFERTVIGFCAQPCYEWDMHRMVREHQSALLRRDCFICSYQGLAVVPTGNVLRAVREIGTAGWNYGIGNNQIVHWL